MARLASNENPWGPSRSVLEAMSAATKYANRYRYPDGNIVQSIAAHHGVDADQVLLGTGSTEILHVAAAAFVRDERKVVGVEPTFSSVYEFATGFRGSVVRLPLRADHHQDIPALIAAVKSNHPNVGLVYVCNPNNPTGVVVTRQEITDLLGS
jgi:histidinol-phosphate aminotransferase